MTTSTAVREERVEIAGCPITVRVAGQGDPLVLLPRENIDPAGLSLWVARPRRRTSARSEKG